MLQLLCYYKEKLTQQSPGDAERLQSTNHRGRQANARRTLSQTAPVPNSHLLFLELCKEQRDIRRNSKRAPGRKKMERLGHILSGCLSDALSVKSLKTWPV